MTENSREALEAYYKEAGSWAEDRITMNERSKRTAWLIATASVILSMILGLAIVFLMPLKQVVPYTLLVDKHTGYVETVKPLESRLIEPNSALTQSFLVQYVTTREGFDIDSLQNDFRRVSLWTAEPERSAYSKIMQASNPESPLSLYPRSTIVKVLIKSVSNIGKDTALVRFDTVRLDLGATGEDPRNWATVVHYRFSSTPMSQEERYINPLGFEVLSYNKSEETLQPVSSDKSESAPASAEEKESQIAIDKYSDETQKNAKSELLGGPSIKDESKSLKPKESSKKADR